MWPHRCDARLAAVGRGVLACQNVIFERFQFQKLLIRTQRLLLMCVDRLCGFKGRPSRRKSDFLAWLELQDFWSRLTRRLTARHLLEVGLLLCQ